MTSEISKILHISIIFLTLLTQNNETDDLTVMYIKVYIFGM